jgi:integrase
MLLAALVRDHPWCGRAELCGLRWDAVDLAGSRLAITRTRVVVDGKAIDSEPKTAAGVRSVPLDPDLVAMLRKHQVRQGAERLATGSAYESGIYVVADDLGRPYHPNAVSDRFDVLIGKIEGLRRIRLHDTRHTAASLMPASGVPVKVVQEMLGHFSPAIPRHHVVHLRRYPAGDGSGGWRGFVSVSLRVAMGSGGSDDYLLKDPGNIDEISL